MDQEFEDQSFFGKLKKNAAELIEFVAILGVVVLVIHFFIAEPHQVSGNSMVPNFQNGDYIITNKIGLRLSELKRGEVIIFENPRNKDQVFIKRVIAFSGEKIKISNNHFVINDQVLNEPYLTSSVQTEPKGFMSIEEEIIIPENHIFVSGDNREGSSDSREWGPLKKDLIIGQGWLRYWPLNKFGFLKIGQAS